MQKCVFLIVAFLLVPCVPCVQAKIIIDPEMDYVQSSVFPNDLVPSTDKILRLDLDLYGDCNPTIFLSFSNFSDRSGNIWTVYTPAKGGYRRVDETIDGYLIQFRPDGYYYSTGALANTPSKGGLFTFEAGKDGGNIDHYDIKDGTAHLVRVRAITYSKYEDAKFFEQTFEHKLGQQKDYPSCSISSAAKIKSSK